MVEREILDITRCDSTYIPENSDELGYDFTQDAYYCIKGLKNIPMRSNDLNRYFKYLSIGLHIDRTLNNVTEDEYSTLDFKAVLLVHILLPYIDMQGTQEPIKYRLYERFNSYIIPGTFNRNKYKLKSNRYELNNDFTMLGSKQG